MAVGPGQLFIITAFRSVAPMAYANPFNGGLLSWIGDPANDWEIISYVLAMIMLCSAIWLWVGAVGFAKTESISFVGALGLFVGLMVVLAEGEKFDPFDWRELTTAGLFCLAFLAVCGRVFAVAKDQKSSKKKGKD